MFIGQTKCSLLVAAAEKRVDQPLIMERIGARRFDDFPIGEREVLCQVAVVTGKRSRQDRRSDEMVAWEFTFTPKRADSCRFSTSSGHYDPSR